MPLNKETNQTIKILCLIFFSFRVYKCHSLEKKRRLKIKHRILSSLYTYCQNFEIIWMRIGQVVRLWNDNFFLNTLYYKNQENKTNN